MPLHSAFLIQAVRISLSAQAVSKKYIGVGRRPGSVNGADDSWSRVLSSSPTWGREIIKNMYIKKYIHYKVSVFQKNAKVK